MKPIRELFRGRPAVDRYGLLRMRLAPRWQTDLWPTRWETVATAHGSQEHHRHVEIVREFWMHSSLFLTKPGFGVAGFGTSKS